MVGIHKSEKGQALIFLVLGMVAFLGMVALAIDGGMIFTDRRQSQNASDASALSGGGQAAEIVQDCAEAGNNACKQSGWNCADPSLGAALAAASSAANAQAGNYDLPSTGSSEAEVNVSVSCGTEIHPGFVDAHIDVTTRITSTTETSFAQLLFPGPLRNRVIATSRVRPPIPFAYGNAIVALRQDCPNGNTGGIHFDGDAIVTITQGGTFSNACYVKDGGVEVDVTSGENICLGTGCWTNNGGSGYVNPEPYNGDRDLPPFSYSLPLPDCYAADMIDQGSHHGGSDILDPGRYDSIRINNNDVVTLNPGLYCVMDDNFTVTGGELYGDGVTIFVNSGDFETNGSAHIELKAYPACMNCSPTMHAMPGVLIYLPLGNAGEASLLGTADSLYDGLVFAPSGTIEVGGTGNMGIPSEVKVYNTQLIGDTIFVHGNVQIDISTTAENILLKNATLEMAR